MNSLFVFNLGIPIYVILICIFLVGTFFLTSFILYTNASLKKEANLQKRNSIFNTFPCEVPSLLTNNSKILSSYSFVFGLIFYLSASVVLSVSLISDPSNSSFNYLGIIILILNVIVCVTAFLCFGYGMLYAKKHIIFSTLFIISLILLDIIIMVYSIYYSGLIYLSGYSIHLGVGIVFGILGILLTLSLLNPKVKEWTKQDKTEVDGTTYYVRKKYNFLAITEWAGILHLALNSILFVINTIIKLAV